MIRFDRRRALISTAGLAAGGMATARLLPEEMLLRDRRPARSQVAIVSAVRYSEDLADSLQRVLRMFGLNLRGKSVLLKPNLVEYIDGVEVNTNPILVGATAEAFRNLGARSVVIAEGPGHQRDTYLVLAESGLEAQLRRQKLSFVDLNRDELVKVATRANFTGLDHLWLPRTVLESDFVVSMPKVKTHHWAGLTLSMKNMFGIVPGTKYGWPKNVLHWKGIHRSILDICATAPIQFVVADGVVAMEGKPSGQFIVQPAEVLSAIVPQTATLASAPLAPALPNASIPVVPTALRTGVSGRDRVVPSLVGANVTKNEPPALDDLLERQRRAPLPTLYGQKPGFSPSGKELVRAGVSEVIDLGTAVVVLFSAQNAEDHAVELMPPQVQLGGIKKSGKLIRKSRWTTAEQLPVTDFRMSRRRLGPGERADGVVVFQRPSFKQSNETLFLQMAESGAVDRPALAPIGFGISSFREVAYGGR